MKQNGNSKQDPISALEDQEKTQRRKFMRAARYTVEHVPSEQLQVFLQEATALFRQFVPKGREQTTRETVTSRSSLEDQSSP